MEEKVLIKGKKVSPFFSIIVYICLITFLFLAEDSLARDLASKFFFGVLIVIAILTFGVCFVLSLMVNITVTNKKVFGFTSKYARADIQIENIESVNLVNPYNISLKTSTGEFVYLFNGFKNAPELVKIINELILDNNEKSESDLDLLKKYKDLLDSGVITQLEFDAKKKEILKL